MCHALQIADAHPLGATAVSWSPAAPPGSLVSAKGPGQPEKRFASSGADNTVKVSITPGGMHSPKFAADATNSILIPCLVEQLSGC